MPESRALLIDNYDSFTFNVLHGLVEAAAVVPGRKDWRIEVRRANGLDLKTIEAMAPSLIVISPGPGRPEDARLSLEVIRRHAGRTPILGICLGMQAMAVAFGGTVVRSPEPVHGKVSTVIHGARGLFEGLPSPMAVGRYHSLCVDAVPACLEVTARTGEGLVMGLRHREVPMAGVQFHPDSFLTSFGLEMLRNAVHHRF